MSPEANLIASGVSLIDFRLLAPVLLLSLLLKFCKLNSMQILRILGFLALLQEVVNQLLRKIILKQPDLLQICIRCRARPSHLLIVVNSKVIMV